MESSTGVEVSYGIWVGSEDKFENGSLGRRVDFQPIINMIYCFFLCSSEPIVGTLEKLVEIGF